MAANHIEMGYNILGLQNGVNKKKELLGVANTMMCRQKQMLRNSSLSMKLVFCITMYGENWKLVTKTLEGVLQNIKDIRQRNPSLIAEQFAILLIADGFNPLPYTSFLKQAYHTATNSQNQGYKLVDFNCFMEADQNEISREVKMFFNLKDVKKEQGEPNWELKYGNAQYDKNDKNDARFIQLLAKIAPEKTIKHIREVEKNLIHVFSLSGLCDLGVHEFNCERDGSKEGVKFVRNTQTDRTLEEDIRFYFVIKQFNGGKLDSQHWLFNGFCEYFDPDYIFLLDAGTKPLDGSITRLYNYMEGHPNCGGCCGEIQVEMESCCNPIVLAQFVEYKYAHMIDKAFESAFGFISVLPGAFSMYRWEAAQGKPLENYFLGLDKASLNCVKANMYLAEDRIMCLSIVAKENHSYYLSYDKNSRAETDPPSTLLDLMKQRRRWINGSNFATLFVIYSFVNEIMKTKHSGIKKCVFMIQFAYMVVNTVLCYFLPSLMFSSFSLLNQFGIPEIIKLFMRTDSTDYVTASANMSCLILNIIYALMLFVILIFSIASHLDHSGKFFKAFSVILGIFFIFNFTEYYGFLKKALTQAKASNQYWLIVVSTLLTLSLYFVPLIFNCCLIKKIKAMFLGWFVYIFVVPLYSIILVIYAYCNIHDLTWGNRPPSNEAASKNKQKQESEYMYFRANFLMIWFVLNILLYVATLKASSGKTFYYMMLALSYILLIINVQRIFFSVVYLCKYRHDQRVIRREETTKLLNAPLPGGNFN
jgi:cellulose synthase/poly-beta-1,6-N-acetylglucosamine synthase-like glycosyltransferase